MVRGVPRGYSALPTSTTPSAHATGSPVSSMLDIFFYFGRRPRTLFTTIVALFLLGVLIVGIAQDEPMWIDELGRPDAPLDVRESWGTLVQSSGGGWKPIAGMNANSTSPVSAPSPPKMSAACEEAWVGRGKLCETLNGAFAESAVFDILLPWTNGSDRLLRTWREALPVARVITPQEKRSARYPPPRGGMRGPGYDPQSARTPRKKFKGDTTRHYREHDELRFVLRSVFASIATSSLNAIHLVTADLPVDLLPAQLTAKAKANPAQLILPKFVPENATLVGQVPPWLNLDSLTAAAPPLHLVHHSEIFQVSPKGKEWITGPSPSFNSLAIEAQSIFIQGLAEHVLYTNVRDDVFFTAPLTVSDIGTHLTGPVFRVQRDLTVDAVKPGHLSGDGEGEWPGLRHANWLLSQRFGKRKRGYLAHIAKTLPTSIWREVRVLWDDELRRTANSRFRGEQDEVQTPFLVTHYTIERHREALLWSYFVARCDADHDGKLDLAERSVMLKELGFVKANFDDTSFLDNVDVPVPQRATNTEMPAVLKSAGFPAAKSTTTSFSSQDGFAMWVPEFVAVNPGRRGEWPVQQPSSASEVACVINRVKCFGTDTAQSVDTFFRRVAFEEPSCGDCAIALLVNLSGPRGLSAFLPPASSSTSFLDEENYGVFSPLGAGAKSFASITFTSQGSTSRTRAISLIHNYRYTIGSTPSRFISMAQTQLVISSLASLDANFAKLYGRQVNTVEDSDRSSAMVTLNDDLPSALSSQRSDIVLQKFFNIRWSHPSRFETPR